MARKRFTVEQIIMKPREAEVGLAQGKPPETTANLGIAGVVQRNDCALRSRTRRVSRSSLKAKHAR